MAEIVNITNLRGELLKKVDVLDRGGGIIITKDYSPVAVLIGIAEYENKCQPGPAARPALMLLGAKKCEDAAARRTICDINAVSGRYYSRIVYVYGAGTRKYIPRILAADLRTVYNKKSDLPLITSLKCGITALSPSDRYFVAVFLSQPPDRRVLVSLSDAVMKSGGEIIVSRKHGEPVHPIAFPVEYKWLLLKTRKELGLPHIIKKFRKAITYVDI
jgi:CTP:molybdopterin cytidylyltransferase MocA